MHAAESSHACPNLNANLPQCACRFSLDRMSDAFRFCVGDYAACRIYQELTVHGRRLSQGERVAATYRPLARAG